MMQPPYWIAIFAAVSVGLLAYIVFEPSALPRYVTLKTQKTHLEQQIRELKQKSAEQKAEISALSFSSASSLFYLEKIAREEFSLIYPGETVVSVVPKPHNQEKQ